MATTISKLSVMLSANTSMFTTGMRGAQRTLKNFRRGVMDDVRAVGRFGAILTGVAGGALAYATKKQFEYIDSTAKLADKIGESTENIQRLRYAAAIMGVSAESMDKAMSMLQQRLGEVTMGTGEAKYALEKLGLSVDSLLGMTPAEQFVTVAEAVKNLGTEAEQTAVAADLFGRAGRDLVGMLQLGSAGLGEMARDADRMRITFTRFDAAQVENMNDAMTRLKFVLTGVVQRLAVQVAPLLQTGIDLVSEWIMSFGGIDNAIAAIPGALRNVATSVAETFHHWQVIFAGAKSVVFAGVADILRFGISTIDQLVKVANKIPGVDIDLDPGKMISLGIWARGAANKSLGDMKRLMDQGPDTSKIDAFFDTIAQRAAQTKAKLDMRALQRAMNPVPNIADQETLDRLNKQGEQMAESMRTPMEKLQDDIAELNQLRDVGAISEETYRRAANKALDDYNKSLEQGNSDLEDQIDLIKELKQETGQFGTEKFRAFNTPFSTPFGPEREITPGPPKALPKQPGASDLGLSDTNRILLMILDATRQPNVAVYS